MEPGIVRGRGGARERCATIRIVSLRSDPVEANVTLPDGRALHVRIGVPADSYVAASELSTVAIELSERGRPVAAIDTVLGPEQDDEARALLRDVVAGLESGALAPTASALEPLADTLR
jgi:hypothetical protein